MLGGKAVGARFRSVTLELLALAALLVVAAPETRAAPRPKRDGLERMLESWGAEPKMAGGGRASSDDDLLSVIRPRFRLFLLSPSGAIKVTEGGHPGSGTDVDWDRDLGLSTEIVPEIGIEASLDRHRLGISGLSTEFRASTKVDRRFVFHGTTYPKGTGIDTRFEFALYTVSWDYEAYRSDVLAVRAGARAYVHDLRATIKGRTPGGDRLDETRGLRSGRPAASLEVALRQGAWNLALDLSAGALSSGRTVLDTSVTLGYRPSDWLRLEAGYRHFHLGLSETSNKGDIDLDGVFVGALLRF